MNIHPNDCLNAQLKTKKSTKRVTFDHSKTNYMEDDLLCKEARKSLWLDSLEMRLIRNGVKNTVALLQAHNGSMDKLDEKEYCFRGLEKYSGKESHRIRKEKKKLHVRNILNLQEEVLDRQQQYNGSFYHVEDPCDHERIAVFATLCSMAAATNAALRGASDFVEALDGYSSSSSFISGSDIYIAGASKSQENITISKEEGKVSVTTNSASNGILDPVPNLTSAKSA